MLVLKKWTKQQKFSTLEWTAVQTAAGHVREEGLNPVYERSALALNPDTISSITNCSVQIEIP